MADRKYRQLGHCSSDAVAIGRRSPQASHRDTVRDASMLPRGASERGGSGRRGPGSWVRYPW